ncbi:MAG: DUF262 domain-containing protein [Chloroflexota bacterium]|nr:DUF262 domain-containing protein [Chloroflexota bacterium]
MGEPKPILEKEFDSDVPDPNEIPLQDRRLYTQPYDLVVESLMEQIKGETLFLRPLSERPTFQRGYVWTNVLASRLIESILLNVPIPPCYLSQNEDFELDVIDGQQRLYSIYRFIENQFKLTGLEILKDLNGSQFFQLQPKIKRQIQTHTLRLVAVTKDSHPEIKFDVFERLNTNTTPLNAQELRNCIYRGQLNELLKDAVTYEPWLQILRKKEPDKRMRDQELVLRFFAFHTHGIDSYRTPQKHWLNDVAKEGKKYSDERIQQLYADWKHAVDVSLIWFEPEECFRRNTQPRRPAINRALYDLTMFTAADTQKDAARESREAIRKNYRKLIEEEEFTDLITRSVDHTRRTKRRFELWEEIVSPVLR